MLNVHYDHMSEISRELSSLLILKKIKEIQKNKDSIIIFTGDFNALKYERCIKILTNNDILKLQSSNLSNEEGTFHSYTGIGAERIDYIFHNESIDCNDYKVIKFKSNGKYPSDHFPNMSDFSIKSDFPLIYFK